MGRRRRLPPFEVEITGLSPKGAGQGTAPDGRTVWVRGAPPGSRVAVRVFARKRSALHARREAMIRPPAAYTEPACPIFGLCGGCTLQELDLAAQQAAKHEAVLRDVGAGPRVRVHPLRGTGAAYAYRNKVDLSFGIKRYLSQADQDAGEPHGGRFLGYHAPGRFDRIVDAEHCPLIPADGNALLATARRLTLVPDAPAPYDVRSHEGFWRHVVLRHAVGPDAWMVVLVTAPGDEAQRAHVAEVAEALASTPLKTGRLAGVIHAERAEVSEVARGEIVATWGETVLEEHLGEVRIELSPFSFFQTNTAAAEVLYDTVGEALGTGGTLLDLYCGTGAIGLYLAHRHDAVLGIEEVVEAVEDARRNAARNGIEGTRYVAARVEDALAELKTVTGKRHLVVDPPRAGLHPKVTAALATAEADTLVYVACKPSSLGRDRPTLEEGGWRMTDLWTVDLFPQTPHVEAVARFVRDRP